MTNTAVEKKALRTLRRLGIARSRDLEQAGVSRTEIRRMTAAGLLERAGRGLYRLPDAPLSERTNLAEVARRVPHGVICLLSALRFHGLTTQNPHEVWLAIDQKAWRPKLDYPPLRLVFMSGAALQQGIEEHEVDRVTVRVFSAAKTVADCFKFRNRVGTDVAVEALRDYARIHPKEIEAVWRNARIDRVGRVIQPYLESLQ